MTTTVTDPSWTESLDRWRASRLRAVTGPYGSAAVVGTHWLDKERRELPGLPGVWHACGVKVHADDLPEGVLRQGDDDAVVPGTSVVLREGDEVRHGGLVLTWFRRLEDQALRVFDQDAPTRTTLQGIGTFDADPAWVLPARLEATPEARITTDQSDGTTYDREQVGRLVFTHDGAEHSLIAVQSPVPGKPGLLVTFSDATSGTDTFGFRFLLLPQPDESGAVVLDFNRAYLPPFAFGPSHSCPLPPATNRLPFAVTAGETFPILNG